MSKTRGFDSVTPLPACGNGRGWGGRPSAQQTGCANPKRANLHAPHGMVNWNGDIASGGSRTHRGMSALCAGLQPDAFRVAKHVGLKADPQAGAGSCGSGFSPTLVASRSMSA